MIRIPGQKFNVPITFPAVLSKSRDYNSLEMLFSTIFNYFYNLSVESKNIHNPKRCNVNYLPLLAQYYRYEYTNVESIELEREIIASVPELHHNKGTSIGIDNALALCKVDKTKDIIIPWFYDKETNTVIVVVFENLNTYKMYDLLKLVVPLGTKITFRPGKSVKSSEEIQLYSWTEVVYGYLDPDKQWYVTPNNVWRTEWDPAEELYHVYVDRQRNLDATRVGNTEVTDLEAVVNAPSDVKAMSDTIIPDEGEN